MYVSLYLIKENPCVRRRNDLALILSKNADSGQGNRMDLYLSPSVKIIEPIYVSFVIFEKFEKHERGSL
ncbi:MAG: hypothetical protein DI626_06790 [Micavibrio aeruginosavorus]|uniref:Uncharacterized protein n=1 Tax=Micavibrio aeruginosavorus TaxID=349221 RepID=A0A2W5BSI9_9BACT|nr:MAG: hypothetical protein DI626_06790 [Micavibrio aeruginosavorus]